MSDWQAPPEEGFSCATCRALRSFDDIYTGELAQCPCLLCIPCVREQATSVLEQRLAALQQPAKQRGHEENFGNGQSVWYVDRSGRLIEATIAAIDRTIRPWAYSIHLAGAVGSRETEADRLRPVSGSETWSTPQSRQRNPALLAPCPTPNCRGQMSERALQELQPDLFSRWSQAASEAAMAAAGFIQCPHVGCGVSIERLPATDTRPSSAASAASGAAELDPLGQPLSEEVREHRLHHRFRCPACSNDFCDACWAVPYHQGWTCEQHRMPSCLFCPARVPPADPVAAGSKSAKQLRIAICRLGGDPRWCLQREELLALHARLHLICQAAACQALLQKACLKRLPCSHWCCGLREEPACLPCLEGCSSQQPGGRSVSLGEACQLCWEELSSAPSLALTCGHLCHAHCAEEQLQKGFPGPNISLNFLFCPSCGPGHAAEQAACPQHALARSHLDHPALQGLLQKPLRLRDQLATCARARLRMEGLLHSEPALQPGAEFDGRPVDYALSKFLFFECSKCFKPYFGGRRECGAGPGGDGVEFNKQELLCATCMGSDKCQEHGADFIEWKCHYCCNVSSWFCWGSTHMCNECHNTGARAFRTPAMLILSRNAHQ
ncbi:hypothetical protein WJX74_000206 [Apatococcus lobatus]|uniref:RING-type domain-containing protein n=1 Tax=Apatococcus lobatus TaxID=904363 RepID=A0AAW1S6K3_9CHLO